MRWKNGAGWTSEVLRVPDGENWDWRVSLAEVEADGPFSVFPGIDRWLVLLSGNGMQLRFEDGSTRSLLPPYGALRFSGDQPIDSTLVEGPSRDFNLMWRRDRLQVQTWHRPLVGSMVMFVDPGQTWLVYLLAGQVVFAEGTGLDAMSAGDTAVLVAKHGRARYALEGGGELLLMRLQPKEGCNVV